MPSGTTIKDVARLASVSKSTVSRVLNNNLQYIRPETIEKIRHAIKELNYQPSSVARSLVSKRTLAVGLLISDIGIPIIMRRGELYRVAHPKSWKPLKI